MSTTSDLLSFRSNEYSQSGEDGVIAEILRRWGISSGWFCEFGAWDGKYGSNCYALLKKGWRGVMIEGDEFRFQTLAKLARRYPDTLHAVCAFVDHGESESSLDAILARTPIPQDFDVLSIDIDSYDYHVWRSLADFRPKLVIIEIDSSTLPGEQYVYDGTGRLTSFTAMVLLASEKGYTPVCHTGNIFFVANEHLDALRVDPAVLADPARLFIHDWVDPTWLKTLTRKLRNMTWQRAIAKLQNGVRVLLHGRG